MQFDAEGVNVPNSTVSGTFDLEKHFLANGLSRKALNIIGDDISSGDMNVDILSKFNENGLLEVANTYNMNILQKKAFVEAVKLLPNYKYKNKNNNNNSNNTQTKHIYVTQQEQEIIDEIKHLNDNLSDYKQEMLQIKSQNKITIETMIIKIQEYGNNIKAMIDQSIKLKIEVACDEKECQHLENLLSKQQTKILQIDDQFR